LINYDIGSEKFETASWDQQLPCFLVFFKEIIHELQMDVRENLMSLFADLLSFLSMADATGLASDDCMR
jgi:hypothetical protein